MTVTLETDMTLPQSIHDQIGQIVQFAKVNRNGVYWNPPKAHQQANADIHQSSLGNGTAGILLTLLEYYRITQDETVLELLEKGLVWLKHELASKPFAHGFYLGSTGIVFAIAAIEEILGEKSQITQLILEKLNNADLDTLNPLNLSNGVSGTLVGLMALGVEHELLSVPLKKLFQNLLSNAKPSQNGVYWDYQQTSLSAPCGFALGNAGAEYCMAHVAKRFGLTCPPLLKGSLNHVEKQFDHSLGNWPDNDAPNQLSRIDFNTSEKVLNSKDVSTFVAKIQPEDNLDWGGGTMGILLSRLSLIDATTDPQIISDCKRDIERVVSRIASVEKDSLLALGSGIYTGLPGFFLSMNSVKEHPALKGLIHWNQLHEKVQSVLFELNDGASSEDLSLFSGLSGNLYAQMISSGAQPSHCIVDPCSSTKDESSAHAAKIDTIRWTPASLPQACAISGFVDRMNSVDIISLKTVRDSIETVVQDENISENRRMAVAREIELHEMASSTNYLKYFLQEVSKARRFQLNYSEGMDDSILFSKFILDASVSLHQLSFNPQSDDIDSNTDPTLLLRKCSSVGVWEAPVSQLQFAVLEAFEKEVYSLDAIKSVVERVDTPGVTQQQLASFCLKTVRAFIQEGHLSPEGNSPFLSVINRTKLKKIRRLLLPSEN